MSESSKEWQVAPAKEVKETKEVKAEAPKAKKAKRIFQKLLLMSRKYLLVPLLFPAV